MERSVFILIIGIILLVTSVTVTPFIIDSEISKMVNVFVKQHGERHDEHLQIEKEIANLTNAIMGKNGTR